MEELVFQGYLLTNKNMNMRKMISIKNLNKTFKDYKAINNLSIEVGEGEI